MIDERTPTSPSQPLKNVLGPEFGIDDPANGKDISLEDFIQIAKAEIVPAEQFFMNYRCAIMQVETKFQILSKQFSVQYDDNPIDTIKTRIKTYDSIVHKTARYGIPCTLPSIERYINDIAGVRVICSFEQDLYRLADCFLSQDDVTLLEKKDYIKNPKPNGYRSLHLIVSVPIYQEKGKKDVKVEVQLRTIAMDFWASAEHKLRYKKQLSDEELAELSSDLKSAATISALLDGRMQEIRDKLYTDKNWKCMGENESAE